jgi:DNA-directed RNA polymerase specialized sigma24 family protein
VKLKRYLLFDFSIEHHLIIDETTASQVAQLNQLINGLPSRQALYLRYTQDLSIEQVADTLDINYQSANNLLHRAIMHPKEWQANILILLILFTISL